MSRSVDNTLKHPKAAFNIYSPEMRKAFGDKLFWIRREKMMSRKDVADRIGRSHNLIQKIESGECGLEIDVLLGLKEVFGYSSIEDMISTPKGKFV